MIKDIVKNLKPSSTLRINEISQALELEGKKVFKFGFGQSPFQVPDEVVDALKNNLSNSILTGVNFTNSVLIQTDFKNSNLEDAYGAPYIGCLNHPLCEN